MTRSTNFRSWQNNQCVPGKDGFTLLEVMIAIAIIAIALTTLLGSQTQSISLATEAKFLTTASLLAKGKMAEIELAKSSDFQSSGGDFGDDFPGYAWKVAVNDFSIASLGTFIDFTSHLKQIDLEVFWQAKGRHKYTFLLRHYRFNNGAIGE